MLRRVKIADEVPRRIVDDGCLPTLLELAQDLPDGSRFARTGVPHQSDMARLEPARDPKLGPMGIQRI